ncbi:P-loop containing nucleoside triphosphate hydrolase protein [Gonapodya prolifera JEL478]|uniref:Replication factor C subunit 5 n=1 Tax=Gonapodya prolifera (strain JEL478) TaxID=1344416 RepID=A0A139AZB0_GONPJ|nr:P-loop containing nucleoside triphosphate hydrolase protein [Gonapodya prolifera JEL478]|eukprot:KXS22088.1 P-loop containing nucleoside triphosphate hydrolase protein [Gonapodya prolifera JEL478]
MSGGLWVDKYRPRSLDKLDHVPQLSQRLKQLAASEDFPHLLFYGPSGAGKKTRIVATMREIYGPGVEKLKIDQRVTTTPSGRKVDVSIVSSNYHLELTPSDVGVFDRVIVQELIKEVAQTQQVDSNAKHKFKVVVLNEADYLSREAQQALRRTMEKYTSNVRIILCANSTSKIIAPIRSRCLLIRVPAPEITEIANTLTKIAKKEAASVQPDYIQRIAEKCGRNLRKAILMLEMGVAEGAQTSQSKDVPFFDWEVFIKATAREIISEQTPQKLLQVRQRLYELLTKCIPAEIILKTLAFELAHMVDGELKPDVIAMAAFAEHRLRQGNKAIFHLEGFVARFMATYKSFLIQVLGV